MAERFDRIWHNARLASLREDKPDLGIIEHGVIAPRARYSGELDKGLVIAMSKAELDAYLKTLEEPKKLEEYTRKELLELPKDDWDALVGTDPRKWSKAVMSIAMLRRSKTK